MEKIVDVKRLIEKDMEHLGFPNVQWVEEPDVIAFYDVVNLNFEKVVDRLEQVYGDTERVRGVKKDLLRRKTMLEILYGCKARIDVSLTRSYEGDIIIESYFFPCHPEHRNLLTLNVEEVFQIYEHFLGSDKKSELEKQELKKIFEPEESKVEMLLFLWELQEEIRKGVGDLDRLIFDTVRKKIRERRELLVKK